ncbi:hypothetical protein DFH06DRAFT_1487657 [Mycena polygramma]|nr:hypothetical protein DFH06DRAFT_1487657 [Mycena polygramma]
MPTTSTINNTKCGPSAFLSSLDLIIAQRDSRAGTCVPCHSRTATSLAIPPSARGARYSSSTTHARTSPRNLPAPTLGVWAERPHGAQHHPLSPTNSRWSTHVAFVLRCASRSFRKPSAMLRTGITLPPTGCDDADSCSDASDAQHTASTPPSSTKRTPPAASAGPPAPSRTRPTATAFSAWLRHPAPWAVTHAKRAERVAALLYRLVEDDDAPPRSPFHMCDPCVQDGHVHTITLVQTQAQAHGASATAIFSTPYGLAPTASQQVMHMLGLLLV